MSKEQRIKVLEIAGRLEDAQNELVSAQNHQQEICLVIESQIQTINQIICELAAFDI